MGALYDGRMWDPPEDQKYKWCVWGLHKCMLSKFLEVTAAQWQAVLAKYTYMDHQQVNYIKPFKMPLRVRCEQFQGVVAAHKKCRFEYCPGELLKCNPQSVTSSLCGAQFKTDRFQNSSGKRVVVQLANLGFMFWYTKHFLMGMAKQVHLCGARIGSKHSVLRNCLQALRPVFLICMM